MIFNEKIDRTIITLGRKALRSLDILGIPDRKLYIRYYKLIYASLNDILIRSWNEFNRAENLTPETNNEPERKVWVMWWQGKNEAPQIIKNNIELLERQFGTRLVIITKDNYKEYTNISEFILDKFLSGKITLTQWSDIVRYNLLKDSGGLWVDSSVIFSDDFINNSELFVSDFFSLCSQDDVYQFISFGKWTGWCIGGRRNYPLFNFMNIFFNNYYRTQDKTVDYFFADDAASFFFKKSSKIQNDIKHQLKSWDPYLFVNNFNSNNISELLSQFRTKPQYSVQKLTYKFDFEKSSSNSLAYYLNNNRLQ